MVSITTVEQLSNPELLEETRRVARQERHVTAHLIALLAELDLRRLYRGQSCSSLFMYCTQVLCLSEQAAYHRIQAARAARDFPVVFDLLAEGAITMTAIVLLRPHLTQENHATLFKAARHKTKREIEYLIACVSPKPDVPTVVRKLPAAALSATTAASRHRTGPAVTTDAGSEPSRTETPMVASPGGIGIGPIPERVPPASAGPTADSQHLQPIAPRPDEPVPSMAVQGGPATAQPIPSSVRPLSSDRYLLKVTISAEAHARLRHAQNLLQHVVPGADPAIVIERALTVLVEKLERDKFAATSRPRRHCSTTSSAQPARRAATRHIPAGVRRAVWLRDQGRCAFVGPMGRCTETGRLEFHHLIPFADGGPTVTANLALRCRAHNQYENDQWAGTEGAEPIASPRAEPFGRS